MSGPKPADTVRAPLLRQSLPELGVLAIVLVVVTVGITVASSYLQYIAAIGAAMAVFGLSIGLIYEQAGMLSVAQVSIGAIGAWTVARLADSGEGVMPLELALFVGAALAVPFGLMAALPALRLRNINLAIVTLGIVLAVYTVAKAGDVPGSELARYVLPPSWGGGGYRGLFLLSWISFGLWAAITIWLRRTRMGLSWQAIAKSERVAASLGLSITRTKFTAFAVAAAIAGWAGGLLVAAYGSADPANFEPVQVLTLFVLGVMMGAGYWEGALALGFFQTFSGWVLRQFGLSPDIGTLIFAVGSVQILYQEKNALSAMIRRGVLRRRRKAGHMLLIDHEKLEFKTVDTTHVPAEPAERATALRIEDLTVKYGKVVALGDVSLEVGRHEVVGLVGPNGAGKSTLVDAVTGFVAGYDGKTHVGDTGMEGLPAHQRATLVRRTFQNARTVDSLTPREYLRLAAGRRLTLAEVDEYLDFVGCPPTEENLAHIDVRVRRLVSIAACIAAKTPVILLDEPAAGLTVEESEDMAARILAIPERFGCGVLLIEHDMELVRYACSRVVVLDFGRVIAEGPTAEVLESPAVTSAYLGDDMLVESEGEALDVRVPEAKEASRGK